MIKRRVHKVTSRKGAAALRYRLGRDETPRLVAKGLGKIAEKIIEAAREAGVPIQEDPDLLAILMTLNIDEMIPPEMYTAVAEVLAFVYRMNNKMPER
ncbi:EscU/YscU/HrcU family type III secretion system export apparatus switch protein [Candidatus Latescibacterota bacterium]